MPIHSNILANNKGLVLPNVTLLCHAWVSHNTHTDHDVAVKHSNIYCKLLIDYYLLFINNII